MFSKPNKRYELVEKFSSDLALRLQLAVDGSSKVPVIEDDPGGYIVGAMREARKLKHLPKGGATTGQLFELSVLSALIGYGVDERRIRVGVRFDPDKRIDGDVVIDGNDGREHVLMLKTSLRERFKQVDRDAKWLNERREPKAVVTLIFWCEHPERDTPEKARQQAQKIAISFISDVSVMTIESSQSVRALFDRLKKVTA